MLMPRKVKFRKQQRVTGLDVGKNAECRHRQQARGDTLIAS